MGGKTHLHACRAGIAGFGRKFLQQLSAAEGGDGPHVTRARGQRTPDHLVAPGQFSLCEGEDDGVAAGAERHAGVVKLRTCRAV